MRITRLRVNNFRCVKDADIPVERYTAFVGANGAGKSTCLYALAWFFGEFPTGISNCHFDHTNDAVEVTLTLEEIGEIQSTLLGQFARDGHATLTRTWKPGDTKPQYLGVAWKGPGFAEVAAMTQAAEYRPAYRELVTHVPGLPELPANVLIANIREALSTWERDPENRELLVRTESQPADSLFVDRNFEQIAKFVLVRGSAELAQQIDGGDRGSPFTMLTGTLVADAKVRTLQEWEIQNQQSLQDLKNATSVAIRAATEEHARHINDALSGYIHDAEIDFEVSETVVTVRNDASIGTQFRSTGGPLRDVALEGHGTQRAVMMSMVQSLAEVGTVGETPPLKVIAIEEPEIYQHPVRSRAIARKLSDLAKNETVQILLATHSPAFVRPEQFGSLRRLQRAENGTAVVGTDAGAIAASMGLELGRLLTTLEKELPTNFSEGFFCNCVFMVEGDTDSVVLSPIAEHLGCWLEPHGISIWPIGSKDALKMHYSILSSLGTKIYVLIDGDCLTADTPQQRESHRVSTERALQVVSPLDSAGTPIPYKYGDETVVGYNMTILKENLESLLMEWPSFATAAFGAGRKKDAYSYRRAASHAKSEDIPQVFKDMINAVVAFAQ